MPLLVYVDKDVLMCGAGFFEGMRPVGVHIDRTGLMDVRPLHLIAASVGIGGSGRAEKVYGRRLRDLLSRAPFRGPTGDAVPMVDVLKLVAHTEITPRNI